MKNILVKYKKDCGKMGFVDGLFVCTEEELKSLYGRQVEFGEILGKHSCVRIIFAEKDLIVLTEDQEFIYKLVTLIGKKSISGYNPLSYLPEEEDQEC